MADPKPKAPAGELPLTIRQDVIAKISAAEVNCILREYFRNLSLPGYPGEADEDQITLEICEAGWKHPNAYVGEILVRYTRIDSHGRG